MGNELSTSENIYNFEASAVVNGELIESNVSTWLSILLWFIICLSETSIVLLLPYNNFTSERFGESILSSNTALRLMGQGYRFFILGWFFTMLWCQNEFLKGAKNYRIGY